MKLEEVERLISDTLFERRMASTGSCFTTNEAGIRLIGCSADILAPIEDSIREAVVPSLQTSGGLSAYPGLPYLLGAYMIIGRKAGTNRTIHFLRGLPDSLKEEVAGAIGTFFRMTKDGYNFGVPPGPELMGFLQDCSRSSNEGLRSTADAVLRLYEP